MSINGNIDSEIVTYSISNALNIPEDEIMGIMKALPCLSEIEIKVKKYGKRILVRIKAYFNF